MCIAHFRMLQRVNPFYRLNRLPVLMVTMLRVRQRGQDGGVAGTKRGGLSQLQASDDKIVLRKREPS